MQKFRRTTNEMMQIYLFVFFLSYVIPLSLSTPMSLFPTSIPYDYVIIGGGTAGLTLASRLSERSGLQIAIVEAGGHYETDSGNNSVVPGYAGYGASTDASTANDTPLIDWGFVTAPMMGLDGRKFHYARGKTLGGSSARNYMVFVPTDTLRGARLEGMLTDPHEGIIAVLREHIINGLN